MVRMALLTSSVDVPATSLPAAPRVRRDLLWLQVPGAEVRYLVQDFRTGLRMHVGGAERVLCDLLDGSRPVDDVAREAGHALRRPVSAVAVARFVRTLAAAGALEDGTELTHAVRAGRPCFMVLRHTDPVFARWSAALAWVFSPWTLGAALALVLGGAVAAHRTLDWGHLSGALHFSLVQWTAILLVEAIAIAAHETAHGVTLRHFGGRVRNVAIFVWRPAAFATVDVSDIYTMPRIGRRAAVLLAGPFANLLIASCGGLLAWTLPDSPVGRAAAFSAIVQYARFALALVPVLESDGYLVVAAMSGIPNLRRVSSRTMQVLLFGPAWQRRAEWRARRPREAAICAAFALGVWAWRAGAAAMLLWVIARYPFRFPSAIG